MRGRNIFYGWYIVIGLSAVGMVSTGMGGSNFGLFLPPMNEDLGISHAFFGWAFAARLIGVSATSWYLGILLDRFGARIPMAVTGLLAGMVMMGLSYVQAGWHLVALYFILGAAGLEGGGGNMYQVVPISRWFLHKRGKAMSITLVGTTVGIFIFSPLSEFLIAHLSWRWAWRLLGCTGGLIMTMVALLVIRKDPQSMGLQPDGTTDPMSKREGNPKSEFMALECSWTREKAVRTFAFWSLVLVHGARMFAISSVQMFRIPFYIEQGIAPSLVAWAVSVEAIVAAAASLMAGRIVDRIEPRFVVVGALCLFLGMLGVTMNVHKPWHVFLATTLNGASAASYIVSTNTLWPYYFGSEHIGGIRGLSVMMTLIFSTIGAPLCGSVKDATGSYTPTWIAAFLVLIVGAVLAFITKKPQPRSGDEIYSESV